MTRHPALSVATSKALIDELDQIKQRKEEILRTLWSSLGSLGQARAAHAIAGYPLHWGHASYRDDIVGEILLAEIESTLAVSTPVNGYETYVDEDADSTSLIWSVDVLLNNGDVLSLAEQIESSDGLPHSADLQDLLDLAHITRTHRPQRWRTSAPTGMRTDLSLLWRKSPRLRLRGGVAAPKCSRPGISLGQSISPRG